MNFKGRHSRRAVGRSWPALWRALVCVLVEGWTGSALAEAPRRVVSINLCTDQLVLALADRAQIAGLGRFARHAEMSLLAREAAAVPSLRGTAEEVLRLEPDLVLAGAFSGRATRAVLTSQGVRLETFAPPRSFAEAKAEIVRAAALLGHPERGGLLVAEIDAAAAVASEGTAKGKPALKALLVQRRGFVSGRQTLVSAAVEATGLVNAAGSLGVSSVAHAPLETILKLRPDVLILEALGDARDQASAFLLHPALNALRGQSRVWRLPVAEVTCGGPALPLLLRRLGQLSRELD